MIFLVFHVSVFILATEQDKTHCHSYRFKNCVEGMTFCDQTMPLLTSKEHLPWLKEHKALCCLQGSHLGQMMSSAHSQCRRLCLGQPAQTRLSVPAALCKRFCDFVMVARIRKFDSTMQAGLAHKKWSNLFYK